MATKKKAEKQAEPVQEAPKQKTPKQGAPKQEASTSPAPEVEMLQKAAKAIGSALGTLAAKTGIAHAAPVKKKGKLVKKDKKRLPRKEKKAAKKKQVKTAS